MMLDAVRIFFLDTEQREDFAISKLHKVLPICSSSNVSPVSSHSIESGILTISLLLQTLFSTLSGPLPYFPAKSNSGQSL